MRITKKQKNRVIWRPRVNRVALPLGTLPEPIESALQVRKKTLHLQIENKNSEMFATTFKQKVQQSATILPKLPFGPGQSFRKSSLIYAKVWPNTHERFVDQRGIFRSYVLLVDSKQLLESLRNNLLKTSKLGSTQDLHVKWGISEVSSNFWVPRNSLAARVRSVKFSQAKLQLDFSKAWSQDIRTGTKL